MSTTILILSVDEAPLLRHSLPAATGQDDAEVVVIDNASTDDTAEVATEHGARMVRLGDRLSYAAAINRGIAASEGDAVLLLNADCFLEPGFLAAARPRLAEDGVGSVAPKLLRTGGPDPASRLDAIDAAGMVIDRRRKNTIVGHGRPSLCFETPGEAFGPDGAAALYRRETLEDCALGAEVLDEDLALWASDVDLAWRARILGWRCAYEPRAVAYHVRTYSPSTRGRLPKRDRRTQFRNRYLMMAKNDTAAGLARDLHRVGAYELLALGHVVLREPHLARGYWEAARLAPAARRRGRALRARARARTAARGAVRAGAGPMSLFATNGAAANGGPPVGERSPIFDLEIQTGPPAELLRRILSYAERGEHRRVSYVNAHVINESFDIPELRQSLRGADLVYCDGYGVRLAARLIGLPVPHRMTGADWIWAVAAMCEEAGHSIYLLGSDPGASAEAAAALERWYPRLDVRGYHHGYFDIESPHNERVVEHINEVKPDVLLVGMGTPQQELWAERYFDRIDASVVWTVGALFDYLSKRIPRAPHLLSDNGLEWVFRLAMEPRRLWRRYLIGNPVFLSRVIGEARRHRNARDAGQL